MASHSPSVLANLLESGKYSDVTLICQEKSFRLHKAVICSQSPVMSAALTGNFMEAATGTLSANAYDIDTVQRMIDFFYLGKYQVEFPQLPTFPAKDSPNTSDSRLLQRFGRDPDGSSRHRKRMLRSTNGFSNSDAIDPLLAGSEPPQAISETDLTIPSRTLSIADTEPIVPSRTMTTTKATLLCHVRVNAIANYYNVPELVSLANKHIESIFKHSWLPGSFSDVAALALRTGDRQIQNEFLFEALKECARNIQQLQKSTSAQADAVDLTTDGD
ncbi:hypothetical protein EDB81DRAFT_951918 [Dactylonectria macrodidyma]|uniref:BTB domain-containing protein n=1 Tax=Dactylonectria macrodidyma TaxID=307937 RepID=A0A9P9IKR0_9HYPO|nr:hypothetical protein EDB81DRAFT_951918 [Dactylonectria macrodidyma]